MNKQCASPYCEAEFEAAVWNQKYCSGKCKRDVENLSRQRVQFTGPVEALAEAPVEDNDRLEFLRQTNIRLARENARLKVTKAEIAEMVDHAIRENIARLKIPALKKPKPDRRKKTEEYVVAVLSDWQVGKRTQDYDVATCERRIELYAEKLLRITELQRADHPVRHLRVYLLGDMVEGEDIFAGQPHHLDKSLYYQVAVDGPRIIVNFLRQMLKTFETIHVVGVAGNHGRIGGHPKENHMHPSTNADRMLYSIVQQILADEDRLTWDIPTGELEGDFYTTDKVGSKTFLLFHGHQIRGMNGVPYAAIEKKIKGWAMGAIQEKFDYAIMGHFHTPTRTTINTVTAYVNGTTESSNGYAVEVLAAVGRPCQYLLFVHPEHGISAEYPLFLDV